jgi:hypothetical protein
MEYNRMDMAEYLLPTNNELSIESKRRLFAARNKMIDIPSNISSSKTETKCICEEQESMKHLYKSCKMLNISENISPYEQIYSGKASEQIKVLQKLEQNLKMRDNLLKEEPCDSPGSAAIYSSFG